MVHATECAEQGARLGIRLAASLAAMDILDGAAPQQVAAQLDEVDLSTRRATAHYRRMRSFSE